MKNKPISVLLVSIFIIGLLTGCGKTTNTATDNATTNSESKATNNNENTILEKFTIEQLKQYNGTNGQKIYAAYKGKVYDLTDSNGFAKGKTAKGHRFLYGKDVTAIMYLSPHGDGVIRSGKVVGELVK